jgi:hypothetical protein
MCASESDQTAHGAMMMEAAQAQPHPRGGENRFQRMLRSHRDGLPRATSTMRWNQHEVQTARKASFGEPPPPLPTARGPTGPTESVRMPTPSGVSVQQTSLLVRPAAPAAPARRGAPRRPAREAGEEPVGPGGEGI